MWLVNLDVFAHCAAWCGALDTKTLSLQPRNASFTSLYNSSLSLSEAMEIKGYSERFLKTILILGIHFFLNEIFP